MHVSGDPDKIAKFVGDHTAVEFDAEGTPIGETVLDFNTVVPMPEHLKNTKAPSDDGSENWYDWSVTNWGTKWGACDPVIDYRVGGKVAMYSFDTAWSPPVDWYEKVIEAYPDLDFDLEWEEGGMGFAGRLAGTKGIVGGIEEWTIIWDEEAGEYEVLR
jgi:hypothetical protein